jgi:hypothetical protein
LRRYTTVQHFDFGYIMRNCHESDKPEFGDRSDMWADKYHKRKLLADEYRSGRGRGRQGRGLLGGDEEEEKEVYTFKKTSAGTVVGRCRLDR